MPRSPWTTPSGKTKTRKRCLRESTEESAYAFALAADRATYPPRPYRPTLQWASSHRIPSATMDRAASPLLARCHATRTRHQWSPTARRKRSVECSQCSCFTTSSATLHFGKLASKSSSTKEKTSWSLKEAWNNCHSVWPLGTGVRDERADLPGLAAFL